MQTPTQTTSSGQQLNVVVVTISGSSFTLIPFVGNFTVTTHATADVS
jgi:hypothetical protein